MGIFPPSSVYLLGFLRKETISSTSCLASERPATSLKVTCTGPSLSKSWAFAFPTLKTPPLLPWFDIRRIIINQKTINNRMGPKDQSKSPKSLPFLKSTEALNPFSFFHLSISLLIASAEAILVYTLAFLLKFSFDVLKIFCAALSVRNAST